MSTDDSSEDTMRFPVSVGSCTTANTSPRKTPKTAIRGPRVRGERMISSSVKRTPPSSPRTAQFDAQQLYNNVNAMSRTLRPQRSTKQLINKYESMSSVSLVPTRAAPPPPAQNKSSQGSESPHTPTWAGPSPPAVQSTSAVSCLNTPTRSSFPDSLPPPPTMEDKEGKPHSPLRQSFDKLISVFKKDKSEFPSLTLGKSPTKSPAKRCGTGELGISSARIALLIADDPFAPVMAPQTPMLLTGTLLFLSLAPESDGLLPVWTTCTVTLQPGHLLVTWLAAHGSPFTHLISLAKCSNIRSLLLAELSSDERALLPSDSEGGGGEPRVWEISFDHERPSAKFAATSVKDRATWISAVWDAVLPPQEAKSFVVERAPARPLMTSHWSVTASDLQEFHPHTPTSVLTSITEQPMSDQLVCLHPDLANSPDLMEPGSPATIVLIQHTAKRVGGVFTVNGASADRFERSLPALPIGEPEDDSSPVESRPSSPSPTKGARTSDLIRFSVYEGTQELSATNLPPMPTFTPLFPDAPRRSNSPSSSTRSRSKSPSFDKLGKLSVVKQRLAQMERNGSKSGLHTPSPSPARRGSVWPRSAHPSPSRSQRKPVPSMKDESSPLDFLNVEPKLYHQPSFSSVDYYGAASPATTHADRGSCLMEPRSTRRRTFNRADSSPASPYQFSRVPSVRSLSPAIQSTIGLDPDMRSTMELEPIVELLHDHAAKGFDQATALGDQISALQRDVQGIPSVHGPLLLEGVHGLEQKLEASAYDVREMRSKLDQIGDEVWRQGADSVAPDVTRIAHSVESMRAQLGADLPEVLKRLGTLQEARNAEVPVVANTMANVGGSNAREDGGGVVDLADVHAKLDGLASMYSSSGTKTGDNGELKEILALLQGVEADRALGRQKQTQSVQCLNQLNSWLESFVTNGSSQLSVVADTVQQLRQGLGLDASAESDPVMPGASTLADGAAPPPGNVLTEIRQVLLELKDREKNTAALQASVEGLASVKISLAKLLSEPKDACTNKSILELIGRQRQDQEEMLRKLSTELSDDIRGERLRFVDAMKEATAINVQLHVEQFKKELSKEVLLMTHEVGRLHKERQVMEQSIAELFAFYSKQKQAGTLMTQVPMPFNPYLFPYQGPPKPGVMQALPMQFPPQTLPRALPTRKAETGARTIPNGVGALFGPGPHHSRGLSMKSGHSQARSAPAS